MQEIIGLFILFCCVAGILLFLFGLYSFLVPKEDRNNTRAKIVGFLIVSVIATFMVLNFIFGNCE